MRVESKQESPPGVPRPGPDQRDGQGVQCPGPGCWRGAQGRGRVCVPCSGRTGWGMPCPGPGQGDGVGVEVPCPGLGWKGMGQGVAGGWGYPSQDQDRVSVN